MGSNLREFVSANERHPESVRVFPWLRPAAGDSVLADPRALPRLRRACPKVAGLEYEKVSFNLPKKSMKSGI